MSSDEELFNNAKKYANQNDIINAMRLANEIISKQNENCCLGVFIILRIKKVQNILVSSDITELSTVLISCEKINKTQETNSCIKIINKFLLASDRPKTKTVKLLSYDNDSMKIIRSELPWNFSFVDDVVGGSSIPKIEHISLLSELGFTDIISLLETNHEKEFYDECKKYNINVHFFNVTDREPPSFDQLDKMLDIIYSSQKILVHCIGGVGRTNTLIVCYLLKKLNISSSEAITLLDRNRKVILSNTQLMFVKRYYGILHTPKYNLKVQKIKLPGLIMMIGCPCSGKTTFSIELLTYYEDLLHLTQDELGRKECEEMFSLNAKSSNIILDNCNVTKEKRKEWIKSYNQLTNKKIWAIYFDVGVDICKERVNNRENHPTLSGPGAQKIIEDLYNKLEEPTLSEGFNEIIVIRNDDDLIRAKNKFGFGVSINCDTVMKFPRTRHLANLGSMSRDDLIYTAKELADFLSLDLVVEEKVDGANLGIFYDHDTKKIKAQNRSHFVDSSYHSQFKLLDKWISSHTTELMEIFDKGSYIIFGEWVYLKHSINYTKLPDYFIAYDIYDRSNDVFLSRPECENMLKHTTLHMTPIIYSGKANIDKLKGLVNSESSYYDGPVEGVYVRAFENDIVKYRGKIVRSNFICGDVDGNVNHWTKGIHTINGLI